VTSARSRQRRTARRQRHDRFSDYCPSAEHEGPYLEYLKKRERLYAAAAQCGVMPTVLTAAHLLLAIELADDAGLAPRCPTSRWPWPCSPG